METAYIDMNNKILAIISLETGLTSSGSKSDFASGIHVRDLL